MATNKFFLSLLAESRTSALLGKVRVTLVVLSICFLPSQINSVLSCLSKPIPSQLKFIYLNYFDP